MIGFILICFAFVFAVVAAVFNVNVTRGSWVVHFGWLAVAFYLLAVLLGHTTGTSLLR